MYDIEQLIELFSQNKITIADLIIIKNQKTKLEKKEKKKLISKMKKCDDHNYNELISVLSIYSVWDPDEAILEARKKKIFSFYNCDQTCNNTIRIIEYLIKQQSIFQYSSDSLRFLNNKHSLSWLYDYYKKEDEKIVQALKSLHKKRLINTELKYVKVEENIIKNLLAFLENLFYTSKDILNFPSPQKYDSIKGYSKETVSDSVSYILFCAISTLSFSKDRQYIVNYQTIKSEEFEKLIVLGCKICRMIEWEERIDFYDYDILNNNNEYVIKAHDINLEKSYRYAYIDQTINICSWFNRISKAKIPSISGYCEMINHANKEINLLKREKIELIKGYPRVRFELCNDIIKTISDNFPKLLQEDSFAIKLLANEYCNDETELLQLKISDNCSIMDVLIVERLFLLFNHLYTDYLYENETNPVIINSLVPEYSESKFKEVLSLLFSNDKKVEEMIDILCPNYDKKIDLMYTPVFKFADVFYILPTFASNSNLIRNCIAYSRTLGNQQTNSPDEPIVDELTDVINKCTLKYDVLKNQPYKYGDKKGEIDVLLISDNYIILIECKGRLFPTNNSEMRTDYDYIQKAKNQLSICESAFNAPSFKKDFYKNHNIIDKPRQIKTCIVFGNRSFDGLSFDGHPVRYINDIENFLISGKFTVMDKCYNLWNSSELCEQDFIDFLSDHCALYSFLFDTMEPFQYYMNLYGKKIKYESYRLNTSEYIKQIDLRFPVVDSDTVEN